MRIEHQCAETGGVAVASRLAQHTLVLADRVRGAVSHFGRQSGTVDRPSVMLTSRSACWVAQDAGKVRGGVRCDSRRRL